MRLPSNSLPLGAAVLLLVLTPACGGSAAASDDPFALIQSEDFAGAIALIEPKLQAVAKGSPEHKELILLYTEALTADSPDRAEKELISAMTAHKGLIEPKDVSYVVNRMVAKDHFTDAIEVMHHGIQTWPKDETMKQVLNELKKAVSQSSDEGALAQLKSLGYV